ncbi:MAG TPA: WYL domain-containing protein [Candidatus Xenobia bacterium]
MGLEDLYPRAYHVHLKLKRGMTVTAPQVAREFDISDRHAQRIFQSLREVWKAPLVYDRRLKSFRYTEPAFDLPACLMTEGQAIGVILAHEALLRHQGTPLAQQLSNAMAMFRECLPRSVSVDAQSLLNRVLFTPLPARPVDGEVLETVTTALERRCTVGIEYYSPTGDETTSRDIDVYHLAHIRGDWYAVAWCHLRRALRNFALSRMRSVRPRHRSYVIPEDFDIHDHFRDGLGVLVGQEPHDVTLEFASDAARWASERMWHPTQETAWLEDGRLRLSMRVVVSMELVRWILSWGGHVQVIAPALLRDQVVGEIQTMVNLYR